MGGTIYRFGAFELVTPSRQLSHHGALVPLGDRPADVLVHLVAHAGQVVSKDALIAAAWKDVAVGDNSLEQAIYAVRRVLSTDTKHDVSVETVPRRGYRFVGDVSAAAVRASPGALDDLLAPHRAFLEGRAALETLEADAVARAREVFAGVVARDPDHGPAHVGLANACVLTYEMSRASAAPDRAALADAERHAREACGLDTASAEAWATLGFVLDRTGARLDALAALRRAVTLEPAVWRHHLRLATVSWGDERLRAAHRTLAFLPGFPQAHWLAATVHVARQTFADAARELRAGIAALDPPQLGAAGFTGVALHWLSGLLAWAEGDGEGARQSLGRELALEGRGHLYARECCANAWHALGAIHLHEGNALAAMDAFQQALARVPGHPLARVGAAQVAGVSTSPSGAALNSAGMDAEPSTSMEAMLAAAGALVLSKRHDDAARLAVQALSAAPPGAFGWLLPVEPLLRTAAEPDVWSAALSILRARAA